MQVRNTRQCWVDLPGGGDSPTIRLEPGANLVDDAAWGRAKGVPYNVGLMACGFVIAEPEPAHVEELPPAGAPAVANISRLKQPAALKLIGECNDYDQLGVWLQQDGRPAVRKALTMRAYEIGPKEPEASKPEMGAPPPELG